jgi:outer membrane usher protein
MPISYILYIFFTSAVLFCMPAAAGAAQPVTSSPTGEMQETLWNVTLNGIDRRETVLFCLIGGKVFTAGKDLQRWRLRLPKAEPHVHDGEAFYPLDALKGAVYRVDEATQSIAIDAPTELFIASNIKGAGDSPEPTPSSLGGFFNYDGFLQYTIGDQPDANSLQANALAELGLFNRWGVGTTTVLGRDLSETAQFIRLDSTWTTDMPASMASLRFGDAISQPGEWGGAARFGGIQWATNFATQPRFISFPMPAFSGESVLPSTVDVYVNNALQLRRDVPAGPFSITDLPAMTGEGDARIVVRDLLGREQIIVQPYYVSPQLLSEGVQNFSYETGLVRQNYGLSSFDYGRAFVSGTHLYGFSDRFTGEIHGELLQKQQTLGVSGSYLWPELGVFNLSLAGSHNTSGFGPFASASFQRQTRWFSISGRTQLGGRHFTHIGLQPGQLAPRESSTASASVSLGSYGSLSLGYIHQDHRDRPDVEIMNASYNVSLGKAGALNLNFFRSLIDEPDNSVSLTFTFSLGDAVTASFGGTAQRDNDQAAVQIQKNLPRGNGYGYRLLASTGTVDRFGATLDLQNDVGLYSLEASRFGNQTGFRGSLSGGVAIMGTRPHFSRRLTNSFALVHVEGLPNVRVYADNQLAGYTDANGDALIPQLRAYDRNPIRIEQADIPLDVQIDNLALEAVPYFRSGYALNFPVRRSRGAVLSLVLADGKPMPAGAVVQVTGQDEEFPVALKGEVYATGLQTNNRLRAVWHGQSCEFAVTYPDTEDPLPNLGKFNCLGVNP